MKRFTQRRGCHLPAFILIQVALDEIIRESSLSSSPLTSDFHSFFLHVSALLPILIPIFFSMLKLAWFSKNPQPPKYWGTVLLLVLSWASLTFSISNIYYTELSSDDFVRRERKEEAINYYWDSPRLAELNISAPFLTSYPQVSEENMPLFPYNAAACATNEAPPPLTTWDHDSWVTSLS